MTLIGTTDNETATVDNLPFMNGVSFVAPPKEVPSSAFEPVLAVNANWVAIMPYAFSSENSPEVHFDGERQWWGEKSAGVIKTIEYAKEKGLKIMLKPHVWVRGQGWTGDFDLDSEQEWREWENSYERYILHYSKISDSLKVDAFCIGLEYKNAVKERPVFWKRLIRKTRKIYSGPITYAANWDNYQLIPFWQDLDFIGINAYFPLSEEETPSVELLKHAWEKDKSSLEILYKRHKKPIVFTEYGYKSVDKGASNQWELEHHRKNGVEPNFEVQQNAYAALFETIWMEDWFYGGFLWKWYPDGFSTYTPENADYTPQNKPVENVIRSWYKKR